jgi:hypothetical protein
MPENHFPVLRSHKLSHIATLKVDHSILEGTFAAGCSMINCNATCCRQGVMIDPAERENILAHTELVQQHMEPHMDKDPVGWFDAEEEIDLDFPSGRAVGTQTRDYGCVFLDSKGWCVLQRAAVAEGMSKFALKPFFCFAFPITVENGVVMVDDPEFTDRPECCSAVPDGALKVIEVCEEELVHVLGKEGFKELKSLNTRNPLAG